MRDPFAIDGPTIINVSGGRTSALMLRRYLDAHDGELPPDVHAVFANTGMERVETLEFIAECESRWGVPIRWVERDGTQPARSRFREVTYETASRQGEPFADLIRGRNFLPNAVMRFCTEELKVHVARDFMLAQGYSAWSSVTGLRFDEPSRVMRVRARSTDAVDNLCPLYDARVTKTDVMAFWKASDFDLRLRPWESNCDLCFMKGRPVRERIMRDHPELVAWWAEQEFLVGGRFHAHEPGYLKTAEIVRRLPLLPGLEVDPDESASIPCSCTDRRKPRRCTCGKRRGQGHALGCAMIFGAERGPRVIYADGPRAPLALDGRAA